MTNRPLTPVQRRTLEIAYRHKAGALPWFAAIDLESSHYGIPFGRVLPQLLARGLVERAPLRPWTRSDRWQYRLTPAGVAAARRADQEQCP